MPSHFTLRRWQASQARLTDDDDDDMAGKGGWRMIREFESSLALRSQRSLSLGFGARCSMLDARRSILDSRCCPRRRRRLLFMSSIADLGGVDGSKGGVWGSCGVDILQ